MGKFKGPRKKRGQKPPPKCKALLLCERTIIEAGTGNVSIIGVFDAFILPSFPNRTRPFTAFLQLTDGIGRYDIIVEIHDLQRDEVLGRGSGLGLIWPDRLVKVNLMIPIPALPLTHPGSYDLVVIANGQEIERQKFEAKAAENAADENETS